MSRRIERLATIPGVLAGALFAITASAQVAQQWRHYSADSGSTRYSSLDQIDKANVAKLAVAWRHPHVDRALLAANPELKPSNRYMATPIMVDGVLYVTNGFGLAEAIDPATGRTLWTQRPLVPGPEGLPSLQISKGVAYWSEGSEARLLTVRQQYLFALDPRTGEAHETFGDGGKVDLSLAGYRYHSAGVPLVAGDVVVVGSSMLEQDSAANMEGVPGDVRAYDVRTGELRWTFHPIPRAGDPATETWENDSWRYTGAGNVWTMMSADEALGLVYLPTSSPTNDMYGGHRLGDNLYTSSVVCLDAKTGKRVWHFQTVHHDLFDYDLPAAPILIDITVGGRNIKALAQLTKQSFVFVLDRATGEPVWPIEERAVPASTVPGETASPTQPFPTKPPAIERQGLAIDDLIDFTPELRAEARRARQEVRHRAAVHAAVDPRRRARREARHDPGGRSHRRAELARGGFRSGDRHALRALTHGAVRRRLGERRFRANEPALPRGRAAAAPRTPRSAAR